MVGKDYFDRDYFETPGVKSGYDYRNFTRDSYLYEAMTVWLNEFLPLAGRRILEIGCAYGWLVEELVNHNFDAYGQDISHWATSHAPKGIRDRIYECQDVEIAAPGKFDLILSFETMEHVPMDKVPAYLKNMYDCLNPGGIWFGSICLGWNNDRGDDPDESHQTLQPRSWWDKQFQDVGFIRRKDIEADAYEIGVQTSRMAQGQFLARYYNWHLFAYEKPTGEPPEVKEGRKIYDRRLLSVVSREAKPKLLVAGSRPGEFKFPTEDFFQIDNWGNYLSYFFDAEYRTLGDDNYKNIDFRKYDLLITALDHSVISELVKSKWERCGRKIGFLDGTLAMMGEERETRERLLELLGKFDIICAHAPHVRAWARTFGFNAVECSHIFPFRFFDRHFKRDRRDGFTILCAGYFDSHSHLSSFSLYLASRLADRVLMALHPKKDIDEMGKCVPNNASLFYAMPQAEFYSRVLSEADLVLKMDNPASVGRIIAEAAAGQIPAVASPDLFQIRCYPELVVSGLDALEEIEDMIVRLKHDREWADHLGMRARERLKASNECEFKMMMEILRRLGFEVERPKGLYW